MITPKISDDNGRDASLTNADENAQHDMSLTHAPNTVHQQGQNLDSTEKARWFLMYFSAFLAILSFVAFLITRDFRLLLYTSLLAYPLFAVINYYFPKRKE